MILLKNGTVLGMDQDTPKCILFDGARELAGGTGLSNVFDCGDGFTNYFCAGHTPLPDGRLFLAGGGSPFSRFFPEILDPDKMDMTNWPTIQCLDCWERQQQTTVGRFYPTCTSLADGTVLIIAGTRTDIPMIFDPKASLENRMRYLDGGVYSFPISTYPFVFQLANGTVLLAGSDSGNGGATNSTPTRAFDTCAQEWFELIDPGTGLPIDDPITGGSAVMYQADKIMKAGGRPGFRNDAYVIDTSVASPVWTQVAPMAHARVRFYLVALPDGKILAVGGEDASGDVEIPELYDPGLDTWTDMAPVTTGRNYHSSAILLPDARVFFAGGNDTPTGGGGSSEPQPNGQIYYPAYLFAPDGSPASRPDIASVNGIVPPLVASVSYGDTFAVTTPESGDVTAVSLMRTGAATHGYDQSQRFDSLAFSVAIPPNQIDVTAPAAPEDAPPGYYMLFILVDGVPSKSVFIKLEDADSTIQPPATEFDDVVHDRVPKNRYISFGPRNAGLSTALRVTLVESEKFPLSVGAQWWVGASTQVCENSGQSVPPPGGCGPSPGLPSTFTASKLNCFQYCSDWGSVNGVLHVSGPQIVPDAVYEVQAIDCAADPTVEANYSCPTPIETPKWGDVVFFLFNGLYWGPPDGSVDVVSDVVAVLDKFQNVLGAPSKVRSDVDPGNPDRRINISDVVKILDAFGNAPYPFGAPAACSSGGGTE